jgi:branched-chain amino acid transport system substrate-binding protein
VHDAYLAKVKAPSEATQDGDYTELVRTIPAAQAFDKPSPDCHLG